MSNESQQQPVENNTEEPIIEETIVDESVSEPEVDDSVDDSANHGTDAVAADSAYEEEIAALNDQILRTQAEAQNARRRAEQDVEKARKFALEKFVKDLLPVADNLERAIAAGDPEDDAQKGVLEGVELTLKSLQDTLQRFKVEAIDPEGQPFDPELHQAMSMVPNPDVEPNTVLNVFQKGYTLNGRLVRPAMVVVASAA